MEIRPLNWNVATVCHAMSSLLPVAPCAWSHAIGIALYLGLLLQLLLLMLAGWFSYAAAAVTAAFVMTSRGATGKVTGMKGPKVQRKERERDTVPSWTEYYYCYT